MRIQCLLKNTQFRNGIELLEVVQRTNSNSYYIKGFRDCSPLSLSKRTGEEFNQCVHKGWENKSLSIWLLSDEPTLWKSRRLYILESLASVWEWVLWAIWLQHLVKTNPNTMHHLKLRSNNNCVHYCGTVHNFTSNCSVPCDYSLVGAGWCIWRTCAVFSQDNLQKKKNTEIRSWQQISDSSISLSTWADALHFCSHIARYERDVT